MKTLEIHLKDLEKLCDVFTPKSSDEYAETLTPEKAYGAAMLTIEQIPKLIKALKVAIQDLNSISNGVGVKDGKASNLAEATLKELQTILLEGGDTDDRTI